MRTVRNLSDLAGVKEPLCLAAGFFDGVHAGHQEVLRRTIRQARAIGGQAWALTFDPHPLKVLSPGAAPLTLTSTPHKLELLRGLGLDGCILIPFTRPFASLPAEAFLKSLERSVPTLRHIFVGSDWRFGRNGGGGQAQLSAWARKRGIAVTLVRPVRYRGAAISSTRIRQAVAAGKLRLAGRLLGRPFSLLGVVRRGNRIGRRLGYPTANIAPQNEAAPPLGIYSVRALVNGRVLDGVASFGLHPTVEPTRRPVLEIHFFDVNLRLYGRRIQVFFVERLRPERRFPTVAALARQIAKDVAKARKGLREDRDTKLWIGTLQEWYPDTIVPGEKKQERKEERV